MKRIKQYKGFGIYERSDKEMERAEKEGLCKSPFELFLPGETPGQFCSPEWEAGSLQECLDFIDSYEKPSVEKLRKVLGKKLLQRYC